MALTTEILLFQTSKEFRDNPDLLFPAFDIVLKADGAHAPAYYGQQIENSNTGYIFLNWASYEKHKAVMDSPSYGDLIAKLKPSLDESGPMEMYHVTFSAPTIAFEKPVTEVLILTLKTPENRTAVIDILSKISDVTEKRLVYGQALEDPNKYILVGGWETVEAHWETAAKPEVAATLDKLFSLANKEHINHTKLSQYRSRL